MSKKNISSKSWPLRKLAHVIDVQGGSQPPKSTFVYEPKDGYIQMLHIVTGKQIGRAHV